MNYEYEYEYDDFGRRYWSWDKYLENRLKNYREHDHRVVRKVLGDLIPGEVLGTIPDETLAELALRAEQCLALVRGILITSD